MKLIILPIMFIRCVKRSHENNIIFAKILGESQLYRELVELILSLLDLNILLILELLLVLKQTIPFTILPFFSTKKQLE